MGCVNNINYEKFPQQKNIGVRVMEKKFKLFIASYTTPTGKEKTIRYYCVDKSQVRRLFFSEYNNGELLKRIDEVKDES